MSLPSKSLSAKLGYIKMRTNTKAVVTGDRLGDHWGTDAFLALAVIIYVQHLQIRFKSTDTKSMEYSSSECQFSQVKV